MDILFSHTTALEVLRLPGMRRALASGSRGLRAVPECAPDRSDLDEARRRIPELAELREPLHLLVDRPGARTDNSFCACHVWSGRHPFGSVVELAPGLYCASPEQVAIQLAPKLSDLGLIALLSELCSYYALNDRRRELVQRRVPATDPERIAEHLRLIGPAYGSARVREALKHTPPGSGSPQETRIALMLSLPPRLGGHGLVLESMNKPIIVDSIGQDGSRSLRKPDIMLASRDGRAHVAIEYDGAAHLTTERQAVDAERTNELTAADIPEYHVNKVLSADFWYMEDLAKKIRRDLGEKPRHVNAEKRLEMCRTRQRLHGELLALDFSTLGLWPR